MRRSCGFTAVMSRRAKRITAAALGVALLCAGLAWWSRAPTVSDAPNAAGDDARSAGVGPRAADTTPGGPGARRATTTAASGTGARGSALGEALASDSRAVAAFGWGSGLDQLGRDRPEEGNPEAPMSLAAAAGGTLLVLDQINQRVLRLDKSGRVAGSIPLPVQAAQDLAVAADGTLLVMDRLVDKSIALIAPDGRPSGELPLLGRGVPEGGGITGVFADGEDVYVEREHGDLVRVGNARGQPDTERPELPGRPTRDGSGLVTAYKLSGAELSLTFIDRATRSHRYTRRYGLGAEIGAVVLLDSDRAGLVYLGALVRAAAGSAGAPVQSTAVLCIDGRDGRAVGRVDLPANDDPDETFRELAVPDEGGVLFLRRSERGAELLRAPCTPVAALP